jgi:hypothetical protein
LGEPCGRNEIDVEQPTCGQGLAAHSALPAKLAELMAAVADVLENHTTALDLEDENARREQDVYRKLIAQHRQTAAELRSTAGDMASQRDLPMARHDPGVMSSPAALDALGKLVAVEEALLDLLQERVEQHRELLDELRRAA